jgi:hypothetical protein
MFSKLQLLIWLLVVTSYKSPINLFTNQNLRIHLLAHVTISICLTAGHSPILHGDAETALSILHQKLSCSQRMCFVLIVMSLVEMF